MIKKPVRFSSKLCFICIQGVQGHCSTFSFCHGRLKKAILVQKMATVRFVLLLAVDVKNPFNEMKMNWNRAELIV